MIYRISDKKAIVVRLILWDYECNETHITPVLTYCSIENGSGKCLAIEWLKFAFYIGLLELK